MTDFHDDLAEIGLTESDVNLTLQVQLDAGLAEIDQDAYVFPSKIHGNGAYTSVARDAGEYALIVRMDNKITEAGAAVNHSREPNCEIAHTPGGNLYLVALRDIEAGEELTHDYRIATWSKQ